ncbi:MAG: PD-(D/E)XK motif protein, partial [Burkholderia sp.]|nr:PD-(D/E)XK motif protein [Burkholderia sp.]
TAPGETSAWGLNQLVLDIEQRLGAYPSALLVFRDRLLSAGYVSNQFYEGIAFEPMNVETFSVGDGFPKLTESMVPSGIRSASYAISLHEIRGSIWSLQHG